MGMPPVRKEELNKVSLKNDIRNGDLVDIESPDDGLEIEDP